MQAGRPPHISPRLPTSRRWLGARHYALFIWLFKRVAVLTVAGTLAAVVVLGACYFLTDETVAFAPSQDGNGGKRRCPIGGGRAECGRVADMTSTTITYLEVYV